MNKPKIIIVLILFFSAAGAVIASKYKANTYYYVVNNTYISITVDFSCGEDGSGCYATVNGKEVQLYRRVGVGNFYAMKPS